jgi:hypothetical protein
MWVLMSMVIAVVLWFLATMLEVRLERAPVDAPPTSAASPESRRDEPSAAAEVARPLSCEASENSLKKTIERARACNVDDDCTLFDYGYPIDCMTSVAKSAIPLLRDEFRKYDETCEFRVFYDCPTEPYVRLALCRNKRCVVELDRRDALRESTLEQLNRRRRARTP